MEIKAWEKQPPKKKQLHLRLVEECGQTMLVVVNASGKIKPCGRLLAITPQGKIRRIPAVGRSLGLQLDDKGCVLLDR